MTEPRRRGVALVFGLFFAVVGAVISIGSVGAYLRDTGIARRGVTAWAHVERRSVSHDAEEGNEYRVSYTFTTGDGRVVRAERTMPKRAWQGLGRGDSLPVLYAKEQPSRNFPAAGGGVRSVGVLVFAVVLGVVFVLMGGGLVLGAVRTTANGAN